MQQWRLLCDGCGKEIKGFDDDAVFARENWDLRLYAHWLEDVEGSNNKELKNKTELSYDLCLDCAKRIAPQIRVIVQGGKK